MSDEHETFDDPQRVAINRVYTRKGDSGHTALVGGQKVRKHAPRIAAYGAVDELNAFIGVARESLRSEGAPELHPLGRALVRVQHQLFNLGSVLATLPEDLHPRQPRVRLQDVRWLEEEIDRCNEALPALRSFVLPGGSRLNADLHVCRTVCRRVERLCCALAEGEAVEGEGLAYLNRLSDALFVWSRWVLHVRGLDEVLWQPNAADGDAE